MTTFSMRTINVTVSRDGDDLSRRLSACRSFRERMRSLHITAKLFSRLLGVSVAAVYAWRAKSKRCVPPPPFALRFLYLIERDRGIIKVLLEGFPE